MPSLKFAFLLHEWLRESLGARRFPSVSFVLLSRLCCRPGVEVREVPVFFTVLLEENSKGL